LIQLLTSQYGQDTRITNLVNNTEIWINPMMNPDGYILQQRYNAAGVDLNRNFPMPNGIQNPDGNAWAPENIAMMNFSASRNFVLSANFHGGALVMNYPWDYTYALTPDDALIQQAALAYSTHNSQMYNSTEFTNGITNGAAWYVITGSFQDWSYGFTNCIDITAEIGYNKWPPASQLDNYWALNQESLLSYMEFVHRGVKGIVRNATSAPLSATISIAGNSKTITTDPQLGDYHRLLLPGTYQITASAEGYIPQTNTVTVPQTGTVSHDFNLAQAQQMFFTGYVFNLLGEPVPNAIVRLFTSPDDPQIFTTNASGIFFVPVFFEGDHFLSITADGYAFFYQQVQFRISENTASFIMTQPIFSDDFENGLTNWTVQSPWAIVNDNGNSVLTDSPAGNYTNNLNRSATLTSPISLQNIQNPVLSFRTKYDLETGYDFVHVEVSLNGTSWTALQSLTGTNMQWHQVAISLAQYAGQNIRLRFRIRTDGSVTADGVYIDAVQVSGQNQTTIVYGDIDTDWIITTNDAKAVLDYAVGLDPLPDLDPSPWEPNRLAAADLDGDNLITSHDAYLTWAYSWGMIPPVLSGIPNNPTVPEVTFTNVDGYILMEVDPPTQLMSFDLKIASENIQTISHVIWGDGVESSLISENRADMHLGFVKYHCNIFNGLRMGFGAEGILDITLRINGSIQYHSVSTTTNTDDLISSPTAFRLHQNHPNPFNPSTTISFSIPTAQQVKLAVYNTKGQLVNTLSDALLPAGRHSLSWNGTDTNGKPLGSGVYFYRLISAQGTQTRKMMMIK
ncbi:MAG: M14 family zinc carboxypeptidase, partial [Candidatus Cloacimonadaceae bacterium]|nr:M14 family zinc carboxypeptidase [Candidatus Cloacimonadaceae bacterium]